MEVRLSNTDVPHDWERIDLARLKGTLLVVGAPDVGKSTFARYIYLRLQMGAKPIAYLDGDPGQSSLGPPTTMTLALGASGDDAFPPQGQVWRAFVGATSPTGHMLPVLVGAARLVQVAYQAGAKAIVYDTTGLIDPAQGGAHLKLAKINLLCPKVVFAIQYGKELEYLLSPLRHSRRVQIIDIRPSPAARPRDMPTRRFYRAEKFAQHFAPSQPMTLNWTRLAVFPTPDFSLNRLVALENRNGFVLGLGIVTEIAHQSREVTLLTPLGPADEVDAIHLGDVELDPETFRDLHILKRD